LRRFEPERAEEGESQTTSYRAKKTQTLQPKLKWGRREEWAAPEGEKEARWKKGFPSQKISAKLKN